MRVPVDGSRQAEVVPGCCDSESDSRLRRRSAISPDGKLLAFVFSIDGTGGNSLLQRIALVPLTKAHRRKSAP